MARNQPRLPHRAVLLVAALVAVLTLAGCGAPQSPEAAFAAAEAALAKGDAAAALIVVKTGLSTAPDSARGRHLLGLALLRSGNTAGAEEALRRARALGLPEEDLALPLTQAMLERGQARQVIDEFSDLQLVSATAQATLQTLLARAWLSQGEPEAADAALASALQLVPQHPPTLLLMARRQAARGDIDGALAAVEGLLGRLPADVECWLLKGDLLRDGKQQANAALSAYRRAVELVPGAPGGHLEVAETLLRLGRNDDAMVSLSAARKLAPQAARGIYLQAVRAITLGDLDGARQGTQVLLAAAPDDVRFLILAGDVELQAGAAKQAVAHLTRVLRLAPQAVPARHLLARAQLQMSEPGLALDTLQPLRNAGGGADALTATLVGDALRASGKVAEAERQYAVAARLKPDDTSIRTSLALTHLAQGKDDKALGGLREAAGAGGGVGPDLVLITAHVARNELAQAMAALDSLETKMPGSPVPAHLRGRALLGVRDFAGARHQFERALALSPTYFPAADGLAAMDVAEKNPDAARRRLELLLAKQPKHMRALIALANLRAIAGDSPVEVAALLHRAIDAQPRAATPRLVLFEYQFRRGDLVQALAVAQDGMATLPQNPELLDVLGRVQLALGNQNQAADSFNRLAALRPGSPQPLLRLAAARRAAGDTRAAGDALRKALVLQPELVEAQRGLITLAVDARDFTAAKTLARSVQAKRPHEAVGYLFEGEVEVAQKHWAEAAAVYRRGLEKLPSFDLARRAHAALGAAGDVAGQDRLVADWQKQQPLDAAFPLYLGDVAAARGDFKAAEALYGRVVGIQPANAVALNNLAWVSGRLGRSGAVALAEKAVALAPDIPGHIDTLAMLLAEKKAYAKALEWQRRALALQPQNSLFRLNLARILILDGRKDQARQELAVLSKLGSGFGAKAELDRLMGML